MDGLNCFRSAISDQICAKQIRCIFCAIGFGAMFVSWMNYSGFWVVGRLSGFTEKETLKTWTVVVTVNSIVGLIVTWIAATILPMAAK